MSPIYIGPRKLAVGVTALIPAAGSGSRMGAATPKQFLPLAGVPVLVHTLRIFAQEPRIDDIILATSPEQMDFTWDLVRAHGITKVTRIVAGGAERQSSVAAALAACTARPRIMVVHDAARPLLHPDGLAEMLDRAATVPAQIMAVPVKDTIKIVRDGMVADTPAREALWAAQTPQVFHVNLLDAAYAAAAAEEFTGTDCASLVERLGVPVAVFMGSPENLKLTTPEDFAVAEAMLAHRAGGLNALGAET